MGVVMVKCPETGHHIPTGIVTDRKSFDATPVFFARVYCAICQTEHEWFAKEAWVCEAEASPRIISAIADSGADHAHRAVFGHFRIRSRDRAGYGRRIRNGSRSSPAW
jgi:hypothetical protein